MHKKGKARKEHFFLVIIILFQLAVAWGINAFEIGMSVTMALLISQLSILLPFLVYCVIGKKNPFKTIRLKKIKPVSIFFAFLIALFSYPVVIFLNMVSMLFVENAMTDVMPAVLKMGLFPGLFFMAVLPAFVEETIFRGMLYNKYSQYRPVAGIVLSAVLFGLMHMNFNQMPYAIYLGIIMAILLEVTDSILAPMIVHFTMNASSTILVFVSESLLKNGTEESAGTDLLSSFRESYHMTIEQMGMEMTQAQLDELFPVYIAGIIIGFAVIAVIALAIVIVLICAVANINGRPVKQVLKKKESEEKSRFVDIWLILFVIYTLYECIRSIGI